LNRSLGRLFIGIPLPEKTVQELKREIWPVYKRWPKDRRVHYYNWHLTLAFLDRVPCPHYMNLCAIITRLSFLTEFHLQAEGVKGFPGSTNARVVYVSMKKEQAESLNKISQYLRKYLNYFGIDHDDRPFIPHITISRTRTPRNTNSLKLQINSELNIPIQRITLFRSNGGGMPYTHLFSKAFRTIPKNP